MEIWLYLGLKILKTWGHRNLQKNYNNKNNRMIYHLSTDPQGSNLRLVTHRQVLLVEYLVDKIQEAIGGTAGFIAAENKLS